MKYFVKIFRNYLLNKEKQEVFAKEIGVSRVMLSRYENGRSAIKIDLLHVISDKLKTPLAELMQDLN